MDALIVYTSPYPKRRIGRCNDGGYVISYVPGSYDCFISGGIQNDISFERAFLQLYPQLPCFAFDGTISRLPDNDSSINFVKKNLGSANTEHTTNLHEYLDGYNDVFMKLDIEGHEFRLLPKLLDGYMHKVKQLVIEIHTPGDIQLYPDYFRGLEDITHNHMFAILNRLNDTHVLVHVHPNNGCKLHRVHGIVVPNVFECTYLRKDLVEKKVRNRHPIPTPIDMKNVVDKPEIILGGYPWVSP